jgi:hypothetical protein
MSRSGIVIGRVQSARGRSAVGAFGRPRKPPFVGAVTPDEVIIPEASPYYATIVPPQVQVTEIQISALRAAATLKVIGTVAGAGAGYFLGSKKHAGWKNVAAGAALGNIVSGFGAPIVGTALFAAVGAGVAYLAGKKPVTGALAGAGASAALGAVASTIVIGAAPTIAQRVAGLDHVAGLSVGGFGFPKEYPRVRWEKDQKQKEDAAEKKRTGGGRERNVAPMESDDTDE